VSDLNKKIYELVRAGEIKLGHAAVDTRLLDSHIAAVVARISKTQVN
jgi:hypothetical protein